MKVGHFFSSSNSLVFRLKMARQIKHVRRRLDKIADDGNKFGLERIDVNRTLVQRRDLTYSYFDASWVIGRDNDNDEIIKLLMQPHPHGDGDGDKMGIGGLGKTTLAKLVYNDQRIDELFQLKMWINIKIINSDSATALALTSAPCHQENVSSLGIEQLQSRLRYNFSGKKYLLVLDDIWNDDRRKWIELKDLIKVGAMGSKIIATTRRKSIASMMSTFPS
ncbi:Disease resistance protein RGA2 [Glycine max]|nr:Disease resistance protein RGA2 [Glycine max]